MKLVQHLSPTAFSDWAGTGNKVSFLGCITNSLTLEGEEQTPGLLCQPKYNNVLLALPEESHKFPSALVIL